MSVLICAGSDDSGTESSSSSLSSSSSSSSSSAFSGHIGRFVRPLPVNPDSDSDASSEGHIGRFVRPLAQLQLRPLMQLQELPVVASVPPPGALDLSSSSSDDGVSAELQALLDAEES